MAAWGLTARPRESSQLFEGFYAIYCGLLLIGVTGLILGPVFHRVMHQLHLPDDDDAAQRSSSEAVAHEKTDKPKPIVKIEAKGVGQILPLPCGERAGVRGLVNFQALQPPHPRRERDLSSKER